MVKNSTYVQPYSGKFFGSSLRLISSSFSVSDELRLQDGTLFMDNSTAISCATFNISNVDLQVVVRHQPTFGDITIPIVAFGTTAIGQFINQANVMITYNLTSGQGVCVESRSVGTITGEKIILSCCFFFR